jgi:hypothetical protein
VIAFCAWSVQPSAPSQLHCVVQSAQTHLITRLPPALQISQGETFVTQTDTEVVPKLCKVVYARLHKLDLQVTFTQVRRLRLTESPVSSGTTAPVHS